MYLFFGLILFINSINVATIPVYANPVAGVALSEFLRSMGFTIVGSAVGTATAHFIDGWLGDDRAYYDTQGSNPNYDYLSNNKNYGQMINSGANNEHCYNTYNTTTIDNRVKSIVKNSFNTTTNNYETQIYCPITNTYQTTNNISYNYDFDTYFIENNEYNYYVTNNYTYVSYYIINNETEEEDYYEIYYEMPDGRSSYDLEVSDIWGEYFIYDVVNYDRYREDDGKTLALYHFDGNTKDSSYWQNSDATLGSGKFSDGKFGQGIYIDEAIKIPIDNVSIGDEFTIEYTFLLPQSYPYDDDTRFRIVSRLDGGYREYYSASSNYDYRIINDSGIYNIVLCYKDGLILPLYINGERHAYSWNTNLRDEPDYSALASLSIDLVDGFLEFKPFRMALNESGEYGSAPFILDELRISNYSMYKTSDATISVPLQPFDSNEILVLPRQPYESLIAVKGRYDVENYRIGGVRPTYPTLGDVYIYLEDDKVMDIQQYQGDGWYSIEGSIYKDGEWHDLTKYDLSSFYADKPDKDEPTTEESTTEESTTEESTMEEPSTEEPSTGDDSGGGSNIDISVSGNDTDDDSGGIGLSGLLDGIGGFFDGVFAIVGKLLEYIGKALTLFSDTIANLISVIPSGVSNLMTALFPFIPKEWVYAIELSLVLSVVAIVIGIFKK